MSKYILVYYINGYPEDGGGTHAETFNPDEKEKMDKRVNELAMMYKEKFTVICAGYMSTMYKYEPVKQVIEYYSNEITE